jgi:S-adenosylmethionine synthetase
MPRRLPPPGHRSVNLAIEALAVPAPAAGAREIVEHKGRGHPDSLCDALAENLGRGLARFYLERFGAILHYNVDKALLIGGAARPAFGGGEVLYPIEIILAGRATRRFRGVEVPVDELAVELGRQWLARNVRHLDPVRDVRIVPRIREVSPDLAALFLRRGAAGAPLANDTSVGVGYAPLDRLERAVLAVSERLGSAQTLAAFPEIGEDLKVLGVRTGAQAQLTVACAFVGQHVNSLAEYFAKKERARGAALQAAREAWQGEITLALNAADGDTPDSVYLTVTGLSAEAGDDGQVGRGNRANGLITPYRPMSLEAIAGKNPLTHTGKLYNLLAGRIAQALVRELPEVEEARCHLASRIGAPITEPWLADVALRLADPRHLAALRRDAEAIVRAQLGAAPALWRELIAPASD